MRLNGHERGMPSEGMPVVADWFSSSRGAPGPHEYGVRYHREVVSGTCLVMRPVWNSDFYKEALTQILAVTTTAMSGLLASHVWRGPGAVPCPAASGAGLHGV